MDIRTVTMSLYYIGAVTLSYQQIIKYKIIHLLRKYLHCPKTRMLIFPNVSIFFEKYPLKHQYLGQSIQKTDQVKTAFKIFEGIWSANFWRLAYTNITSVILEYFAPFIKNRLHPDYPNNNLFPLVWKIKSKTNFWRFNQ